MRATRACTTSSAGSATSRVTAAAETSRCGCRRNSEGADRAMRAPATATRALLLAACLGLAPRAAAQIRFTDNLAARAGVDSSRDSETPNRVRRIEPMIGGVALLDYDNDGRLDIYLRTAPRIPGLESATRASREPAFYRNGPGLVFGDVTARPGVDGSGYAMRVAADDYDGDGWTDLYVTGVNKNILYRNKGDPELRGRDRLGRSGRRARRARESSGRSGRASSTTTTTAISTCSSSTTRLEPLGRTALRRVRGRLPHYSIRTSRSAAQHPVSKRRPWPLLRSVPGIGDRQPAGQGNGACVRGLRLRRLDGRLHRRRCLARLPVSQSRRRPLRGDRTSRRSVAYVVAGRPVSGMGARLTRTTMGTAGRTSS